MILWDQQTAYKAGKDGLFQIADVRDCFSRKGRKTFCFFQLLYGKLFIQSFPSTHCAIVWALRQLLQVHPCRCLQVRADKKMKVHVGWHNDMSLGLGLGKTCSAPVRKVRVAMPDCRTGIPDAVCMHIAKLHLESCPPTQTAQFEFFPWILLAPYLWNIPAQWPEEAMLSNQLTPAKALLNDWCHINAVYSSQVPQEKNVVSLSFVTLSREKL